LRHHELSHDYWTLGMIQISMAHMTNAGSHDTLDCE
jgi:hypothetical protein